MQRLGRGRDRGPVDGDGETEPVGAETTESIFAELAALAALGAGASGGVDVRPRGDRQSALGPERAAEILGRLSARTETPSVRVPADGCRRSAPPRSCAASRPQTIALVLANLHTNLAAGVLARLPERQQPDIALRIARMGETSAQVDPDRSRRSFARS